MKKIRPLIAAGILFVMGRYFMYTTTPMTIVNVPGTGNNRQTYTDVVSGFEYRYPKVFSGNVRHPTTWPMTITIVSKTGDAITLGCPGMKNLEQPLKQTQGTTKSGLNYTLYQGSGIGAGQLYSSYCYIIQGTNENYALDFEIWSHSGCGSDQCGAYCGTQFEQECRNLDRAKDIEEPINEIVASFKIIK